MPKAVQQSEKAAQKAGGDDGMATRQEVHDVFELLNWGLDEVRERVDEALVRLDVGRLNVRGEVREDIDRSVNALLAAKSKLLQLGRDLGRDVVDAIHDGTVDLGQDAKEVFSATRDAATREPGH